jgi:hypothetical protein
MDTHLSFFSPGLGEKLEVGAHTSAHRFEPTGEVQQACFCCKISFMYNADCQMKRNGAFIGIAQNSVRSDAGSEVIFSLSNKKQTLS